MLQGRLRHDPTVTIDDYLEIIARKTASLFELGARTAAYLAGAGAKLTDVAAESGHHLGMAFQMTDDLLDVAGRPSETGKPTSSDLRDGNPSMPIVLALERDPELRRLFSKPSLDDDDISRTVARICASGVLETVRARAESHVGLALERIRRFPHSEARDGLVALAQRIATRSV
jgi:octaprenyl-diphosphate synthase